MDDDVATAARYFEQARSEGALRRGLRKNLGYGYAWLGQIEPGAELLETIPEAQYEMELYAQWWPAQGRIERGRYAAQMAARLGELGLPYTANPLERIP